MTTLAASENARPPLIQTRADGAGSSAHSLALAYALTIVGFALVSAIPVLAQLPSQTASLPYRAFVVAVTLVVVTRWCIAGARLYRGVALQAAAFFWALALTRLLWDIIVDPLSGTSLGVQGELLVFVFAVTLLPAVAFLEVPTGATLRTSRNMILVIGSLALVVLVWLAFRTAADGVIFHRLATDVLNPISVGHLAVSVFLVSASSVLNERLGGGPAGKRLLLLAVGAGAFIVAVASFSRGPLLAALSLGLLLAFTHPGLARLAWTRVTIATTLLLIVLGVAVTVVLQLEERGVLDVVARFSDGLSDESSAERFDLIAGALSQFAQSPIIGDAFTVRGAFTYPHNAFVETAMALGIIGLIPYCICMVCGVAYAARVVRRADDSSWVGLLFLQYALASMVSGSVFTASMFWALLFACSAVGATESRSFGTQPHAARSA